MILTVLEQSVVKKLLGSDGAYDYLFMAMHDYFDVSDVICNVVSAEEFIDLDIECVAEACREELRDRFVEEFRRAAPDWYDYNTDTATSCPWCAPWCSSNCPESYGVSEGKTVEEMARSWLSEVVDDMYDAYTRENLSVLNAE